MKTIITAIVVLLSACVDFDPATLPPSPPPVPVLGTQPITESAQTEQADPEVICTADCYTFIVDDTWFNVTRADGSAWDADGTLPEVYVAAKVNGIEIGRTTTADPSTYRYYDFEVPMDRAHWGEAIASVALHVDDRIDVGAYDADGYLVGDCWFKLSPLFLTNGNVACLKDTASIYVRFVPEAP